MPGSMLIQTGLGGRRMRFVVAFRLCAKDFHDIYLCAVTIFVLIFQDRLVSLNANAKKDIFMEVTGITATLRKR